MLLMHYYDLGICEFGKEQFWSLVWFEDMSIIVGHLMPNPLYTCILNMYDFVWLGFMAYQLLLVI